MTCLKFYFYTSLVFHFSYILIFFLKPNIITKRSKRDKFSQNTKTTRWDHVSVFKRKIEKDIEEERRRKKDKVKSQEREILWMMNGSKSMIGLWWQSQFHIKWYPSIIFHLESLMSKAINREISKQMNKWEDKKKILQFFPKLPN